MLKNKDIVCISSIDWDFIWQGHQEIMSQLAAEGNRVLFIENTGVRSPRKLNDVGRIFRRLRNWLKSTNGFRCEKENLYVFSPLVLPFPYSSVARWINRGVMLFMLKRWFRAMGFSRPLVWSFLPTALTLDLAEEISPSLFLYYCIDSFADSSSAAARIVETEHRTFAEADLVFVTSHKLKEYAEQYREHAHFFPFGVSLQKFTDAFTFPPSLPEDIQGIPSPRIGYVGGLHQWVDYVLLYELASEQSGWSFLLVGPEQVSEEVLAPLRSLSNVFFLGKKEHNALPAYIYAFDCSLVPYRIAPYTDNVYPTKLNEYLALGKGVVSTPLREVRLFQEKWGQESVAMAENAKGFAGAIKHLLENRDSRLSEKRREIAAQNSWSNRIEEMSSIIEEKLKEKEKQKTEGWQERFSRQLQRGRKKVLKFGAAVTALIVLLFYTPFLWWIAEPLRIADMPVKADVIVVFGGGVGESGKSGLNYVERVKKGVELYKQGYAKKILFSVGDLMQIKETRLMSLLAVDLGVAPRDILLEEKAGNTYENVLFSAAIMKKHHQRSVLLVTSPYHTLRAKLTFEKNEPDIHLTLIPSESPFYKRGVDERGKPYRFRQVNFSQLQGIFHEYLGILYYYFKGWV